MYTAHNPITNSSVPHRDHGTGSRMSDLLSKATLASSRPMSILLEAALNGKDLPQS